MSAPPPEPAQSRWDVVALAVMGGVMVGLTAGKVPPALAEIGTDLGMDRVTAGWLASLYFAVGAGCAVIAGMLGSRTSALAMVVGGLVVMAAGAAAGAFAPSSGLLLAMRVVEGIGFTTVAVAGPKLIFDATRPADRDVALGIWSIFMPAGMALAMLGTTLLLGELGWRGVWLLSVAVMLAFALLILAGTGTRRFPGQSRPEPGAPLDWAGARATLARPVLWYYAGAFLLYTVSWFAVAAWLPTFLVETQARSAMAAGLFTALVVGANMGGNLSGGWLLARGLAPLELARARLRDHGGDRRAHHRPVHRRRRENPSRHRLQHGQRRASRRRHRRHRGARAQAPPRPHVERLRDAGRGHRHADRAAALGHRGRRRGQLGERLVGDAGLSRARACGGGGRVGGGAAAHLLTPREAR